MSKFFKTKLNKEPAILYIVYVSNNNTSQKEWGAAIHFDDSFFSVSDETLMPLKNQLILLLNHMSSQSAERVNPSKNLSTKLMTSHNVGRKIVPPLVKPGVK